MEVSMTNFKYFDYLRELVEICFVVVGFDYSSLSTAHRKSNLFDG